MNHTPNPFTNRGVITNEAGFIGREEQLGEITERRIGKSSLLYHLAQTGARRIEDAWYRFFYLNQYEYPRGQFSHAYRIRA